MKGKGKKKALSVACGDSSPKGRAKGERNDTVVTEAGGKSRGRPPKLPEEKFRASYGAWKNHISHGNCYKLGRAMDERINKILQQDSAKEVGNYGAQTKTVIVRL